MPIPEDYICPITMCIMSDPVMTCDGHTFERKDIEEWFKKGNKKNPMTNTPLKNRDLIPNISIRRMIQDFKEGYGRKVEEAKKKKKE